METKIIEIEFTPRYLMYELRTKKNTFIAQSIKRKNIEKLSDLFETFNCYDDILNISHYVKMDIISTFDEHPMSILRRLKME